MHQRVAFDLAPGLHCELCIVFMPALLLQERGLKLWTVIDVKNNVQEE